MPVPWMVWVKGYPSYPFIPMNKKPMCDWGRQLQSWSHQSLRSRRREKLGGCFVWCGKKGRKIPNNHRLDVENLGIFMGLAIFFVEILIGVGNC